MTTISKGDEVKRLTSEGRSIREIMAATGMSMYGVRWHRRNLEVKRRHTDRISEHRRRIKRKAADYSGGRCLKCGYDKSVAAMDFHHLDPDKKDFKISGGKSIGWDRIKSELDKTILLCKNCHSECHDYEWDINPEMVDEQYRIRCAYVDRDLMTYRDVAIMGPGPCEEGRGLEVQILPLGRIPV